MRKYAITAAATTGAIQTNPPLKATGMTATKLQIISANPRRMIDVAPDTLPNATDEARPGILNRSGALAKNVRTLVAAWSNAFPRYRHLAHGILSARKPPIAWRQPPPLSLPTSRSNTTKKQNRPQQQDKYPSSGLHC